MDFDDDGATGVPALGHRLRAFFCTISEQPGPNMYRRALVASVAEEWIRIDVRAFPIALGIGHNCY